MKIFLGKNTPHVDQAWAIAKTIFNDIERIKDFRVLIDAVWRNPDVLLSYLWPLVIPTALLNSVNLALNFHPGSRDYPGVGCYNFALYEGATEFGAVCHMMAPKVDTGLIVDERRFPIYEDSVQELQARTHAVMLAMFHDTCCRIKDGEEIQPCGVEWSRKPFTRTQLDVLSRIDPGMDAEEIARRVRATSYPGFPPYVELGGHKFYAECRDEKRGK